MRTAEIRAQIRRGEYQVDAHAVAEAIIRRMLLQLTVTARIAAASE